MNNNWVSNSFYNTWSQSCYHGQDAKPSVIYKTTEELYVDFTKDCKKNQ